MPLRRLLMAFAIVAAQLSAAALAQPAAAQQACSSSNTPELPSSTLPIELLDYLERTASSPFVEAFLLAHMTEGGNADHWLGRCVKTFLDTPADSLAKLRQRRISVDQIIAVLRSAEEARLADARLRESSTAVTVLEVFERLRTATDASTLAANGPYVSMAANRCRAAGTLCADLRAASAKIDTMRAAYETHRASLVELERANAAHLSAKADSLRLATELAAADARKGVVDSLIKDLEPRMGEQGSAAQADSLKSLKDEQDNLQTRVGELRSELAEQPLRVSTTAGVKTAEQDTVEQRQGAIETARAQLQLALTTARDQLRDGDDVAARPIQLVDRTEARLNSIISSPAPLVASGEIQSAQSPNILLELTDFIIERTKQELVIGYLVQLYAVGVDKPSVRAAFPETFRMMSGLSENTGKRLSATAAGRVPLNVWRATISEDYRHIPITLARHLCGEKGSCRSQLASAEPALLAAERLIDGDPVFDVLRDLPAALRTHGTGLDTKLRDGLSQGLSIAATLADAVRVQGIAPTADPVRHPYILSGRALSQLSKRQADAFLRVLLIDALPGTVNGVTVDPAALLSAAERATRAVEGLAATVADSGRSADHVIRSASNAFGSGIELARTLLPADQHPHLIRIQSRWIAVFGVLEPLARGDYSLVMPRTLALVDTLGGDQVRVPAPVLTMMGLATSLSTAQTGADVRSAFESAAAPVGLWQEKRYQQGARVSITAFPGFTAGHEWLDTDDGWGTGGYTVGLSMPVGLEVQLTPRSNSDKAGGDSWCFAFCSVGLYVSVIDLGALASYRVSDTDSANVAPNTSFRQVFAPGVHVSLGLGRTPLALLVGAQVMPDIRQATKVDGTTRDATAIRAGVAIVADVTLFRF